MASTGRRRRGPQNSAPVTIVQWHCRGFRARAKRAALRLYLSTLDSLPADVALQEPGDAATLTNYIIYQRDAQTALGVHKDYTASLVDLECNTAFSHVMATLLPVRKGDPAVHVLNVYSSPKLANVSYAELFNKALKVAGREPLLIVGDFDAPSPLWGYRNEEKRGRKLAMLISTLGLTLHTDPAHPTRIGNSVTRDTCPDLTFTKNIQHADWLNTKEALGSDHCILLTTVRTKPLVTPHGKATLPDWTKFRQQYNNTQPIAQQGYANWTTHLIGQLRKFEQYVQLSGNAGSG